MVMQHKPTNITIREATADDAVAVTEVSSAAFAPLRSIYRPTSEAIARQAERTKRGEAGTRLVAEIAGRVVGTVQFANNHQHIHVIGLAVSPDFQRLGVARRMLEWIVALATSLGRNRVVLETIKETGNVPLFENLAAFFLVGLTAGAVCAGLAISAMCGMSVKRATIAAAI